MKCLFFCLLLASTLCSAADREPRHIVTPVYPPVARQSRIQGSVTVTLNVAPDGKVHSATPEGGHSMLKAYAASNAQNWTFQPSGSESRQTITYVFAFEGEEQFQDSRSSVVFDFAWEGGNSHHTAEADY